MKMSDKILLKILAISIAVLIVVSCMTLCIAVGNLNDNASHSFDETMVPLYANADGTHTSLLHQLNHDFIRGDFNYTKIIRELKLKTLSVSEEESSKSNYTFSLHGNVKLLWSYVNEERDAEILFDIINDVNGDGIKDVLIYDSINKLLLISGKDGSIVWSKSMPVMIGLDALGDDANGDGIGDIIINYEETNENSLIVELVSGCDGSEIWRKNVGKYDAAHAIYRDLDGDGILDILLEAHERYNSYDAYVICALSAKDGSKLWNRTFEGYVQGYCYCDQDVTGDNIYDFVISTYNRSTNVGELFAIRGSDGYVEWHKSFTGNPDCWGCSGDDFDVDGLPDLELEIRESTNNSTRVLVLKGSDGSIIWSKLYNLAASGYGFDEINADGTTDLCLELRDFATFRLTELQVLSGLDGSEIWSKAVDVSDVASCGDLNGDGKRDILLVKSTKLAENRYSYDVIAINGSGEGKIWENSFMYHIEMDMPEGASGYISAYAGSERDFNGDEIKDISLKIRYNDYYCSANKLFFISGKDGSELWNVEDTLNERTYVWNKFRHWYDFNNDGISDVLLGTKKRCVFAGNNTKTNTYTNCSANPNANTTIHTNASTSTSTNTTTNSSAKPKPKPNTNANTNTNSKTYTNTKTNTNASTNAAATLFRIRLEYKYRRELLLHSGCDRLF
jgi:hypothetical protein